MLDVSGDCSGNDGADCKCVADDTTRAIVGWRSDALWISQVGNCLALPPSDEHALMAAAI